MDITIRVHPKFSSRVNRGRLVCIARKTLRAENIDGALTIYVTNDREIRTLNRKFLGTNTATDVLAFPTNTPVYLGDIVISYERARAQVCLFKPNQSLPTVLANTCSSCARSKLRNSTTKRWYISDELELLAVHGILHLIGYDDQKTRHRRRMWKRQIEILGHVAGAQLK